MRECQHDGSECVCRRNRNATTIAIRKSLHVKILKFERYNKQKHQEMRCFMRGKGRSGRKTTFLIQINYLHIDFHPSRHISLELRYQKDMIGMALRDMLRWRLRLGREKPKIQHTLESSKHVWK